MQDSAKYLIHADIRASGVVERSDVVGAIFGQTEGLLGDELDLRDLQESSKVGRIDVEIESEGGRSFGTVTIASGLDKVETAVLAAGLETIDRVGPCRAEFEVTDLEDAREAKRRAVVERATELLAEFEASSLSSRELVEEVRQNVRVEHVTEYEGLPAGPRVGDSDAIIVVEGRADVLTLLRYGIKNAVAVEGTDVPDAIAELTYERTVTAFLDGDRGGDLILKELAQVGDVDYVTFAPAGQSVEDLSRTDVLSALRKKVPYAEVADTASPHEQLTADVAATPNSPASGDRDSTVDRPTDSVTDTSADPDAADDHQTGDDLTAAPDGPVSDDSNDDVTSGPAMAADGEVGPADGTASASASPTPAISRVPQSSESVATSDDGTVDAQSQPGDADNDGARDSAGPTARTDPQTLAGHVEAVVEADSGTVRLLDESLSVLAEAPAADAFETIESASPVPRTVVLDGELTQRVLDVAAQRGVDQIVARQVGEFVKQPTNVRVRAVAEV